MEFADYLRAERERRRLTLDQVAGETKIASHHLVALERGDVRNWPGGMYRRAMMRAYAESIGVDREFALQQFERAFEEPPPAPSAMLVPPEPAPPADRRRPSRRVLSAAAACIGVVIGLGLWHLSQGDGSGSAESIRLEPVVTAEAAPPRTIVRNTAAPAATPIVARPVAAPVPRRAPAAGSEGLLIVLSEPPGARVTVNGIGWGETPVTIRHLPPGDKRVRLTKQGYVSQERVVRVGPERPDARVRLTLRERAQASSQR